MGLDTTAKFVGALNEPSPLPKRMDTLFEPELATARSGFPSPLKSATATECGFAAALKLVAVPNEPSPLPRRIDTLFEPEFATARSGFPSRLKSPTAIENG